MLTLGLLALQGPTLGRRSVVLPLAAAPIAAAPPAAGAWSPLDVLFGWIPPVDEAPSNGVPPDQLTTRQRIMERRRQLEREEIERQAAEFQKIRANSAASVVTDNAGRQSGSSAAAQGVTSDNWR